MVQRSRDLCGCTGDKSDDSSDVVLCDHDRCGQFSIVFTPGDHTLTDTGDSSGISVEGIAIHRCSCIVDTVYDRSAFQISGYAAASGVKLVVSSVTVIASISMKYFSENGQIANTSAVDYGRRNGGPDPPC